MSAQEAEELCVSGMEEAPPLTVAQARKLSGKDVYVCVMRLDEAGRVLSVSMSATTVPDPTVEAETYSERISQERFLAQAADGEMPSACEEYNDESHPRHAAIVDNGQVWRLRNIACDYNREPPPTFPWEQQ